MDYSVKKGEARKAAFLRRKTAFEQTQYSLKETILDRADGYEIIASYMPMRTEINPLDAMQALSLKGKKVVVPVIEGASMPLRFFEWFPDCEMEEGTFGALIPKGTKEFRPELVFAPLVAFDEKGTRLGYGGGFYDRSLALLRQNRSTPYIGLAFEAQISEDDLPRERTDIPLDAVITENGFREFE